MTLFRHLTLIFAGCLLLGANLFAQNEFEPTLLILSPHSTYADKSLKKEIATYDSLIKSHDQAMIQDAEEDVSTRRDLPENIALITQKQQEFSLQGDFYGAISTISEEFLLYQFYERFPNLLIYAVPEKRKGKPKALNKLAESHNMQYVMNFPEVRFSEQNGKKQSLIRVQLFDRLEQKFLLDKEYQGEDYNPGFEFGCDGGTLQCTINNALSQALNKVKGIILAQNPGVIRERQLAEKRAEVLFTSIYPQTPNPEIVSLIRQTDSAISTQGYYQGFMDESQTKFIGFFLLDRDSGTFKDITETEDKQVNIITSDITDLDNMPSLYAYVVLGVKYGSKWYLSKQKVNYFNAESRERGRMLFFNNLQQWNFFQEGSTEINPDFWETYFFDKETDPIVRYAKEIAEYKAMMEEMGEEDEDTSPEEMIAMFHGVDLDNEEYRGLYTIVAKELKQQKANQIAAFEQRITDSLLTPFFDQYVADSRNGILDYIQINTGRFALIYPKDTGIILCPILFKVEDEKREMHYFVFLAQEEGTYASYKWEYFEPIPHTGFYGGAIVERIETLTDWNFSFDYLEDETFWQEYVLKKSDGAYVYLKAIE